MKWILLPGFDGTGMLFAPLLRALPQEVEPVVVAYPSDRICSARELVEIVLAHLPHGGPFVLIAESFSGPIALNAAARHPVTPVGVVLCASFAHCPRSRLLIAILKLCRTILIGSPPRWMVQRYLTGDAPEEVVALFYRAIGAVNPHVLTGRFSVLLEFDEDFVPSALKCPLLYLQAGGDRLVKPGNFEIVQRCYSETHFQKIDSPHLILQLQPQASVRVISEFLARLRPAAPDAITKTG
jgi:pimeloyl-ACP methyl ester carboxylesterase